MRPLVSVILPAFNCESYIKQAVDSILNQTYRNIEILAADDGSNDNTKEIINSYQDNRIKTFHNDKNSGVIFTRNKLFELAKGDLLTVQDGDDWSHPERIERQVDAFLKDDEIGGCGTNYIKVQFNNSYKLNKEFVENKIINDSVEIDFHPASFMIKREVYNHIGGLERYFDGLFGEDKYWISKILENYKVISLKEPLYYYRTNPISLTNQIDNKRKLIIIEVVKELIDQRKKTGTDWLEKKDFESIKRYEITLLKNNKFMSEQYRKYSAIAIDQENFINSILFLRESLFRYLITKDQILTIIYLIRQSLFFYLKKIFNLR